MEKTLCLEPANAFGILEYYLTKEGDLIYCNKEPLELVRGKEVYYTPYKGWIRYGFDVHPSGTIPKWLGCSGEEGEWSVGFWPVKKEYGATLDLIRLIAKERLRLVSYKGPLRFIENLTQIDTSLFKSENKFTLMTGQTIIAAIQCRINPKMIQERKSGTFVVKEHTMAIPYGVVIKFISPSQPTVIKPMHPMSEPTMIEKIYKSLIAPSTKKIAKLLNLEDCYFTSKKPVKYTDLEQKMEFCGGWKHGTIYNGWKRYDLNMGLINGCEEWNMNEGEKTYAIGYHGLRRNPLESAVSIIKNGFQVFAGKNSNWGYNDPDIGLNKDKFKLKICGPGVFSVPEIKFLDLTYNVETAQLLKPEKTPYGKYILISFLCKIKPDAIRLPKEAQGQYYIINLPKNIVPVAVLIKKLPDDKATFILSKQFSKELAPSKKLPESLIVDILEKRKDYLSIVEYC